MPRSKAEDVVARGADVPLALSSPVARDALLDPREGDIIPDLESKGLHVGEVAQPAEAVLHRSGDVTFESLPEAPESRFTALSFAEQKRANSEMQAKDPAYAGRPFVGDEDPYSTSTPAERLARADATSAKQSEPEGSYTTKAALRERLDELDAEQPPSSATRDELQAAVDSAEVEKAQAPRASDQPPS